MGLADLLTLHRWGTALLLGAFTHGIALKAGDPAAEGSKELVRESYVFRHGVSTFSCCGAA